MTNREIKYRVWSDLDDQFFYRKIEDRGIISLATGFIDLGGNEIYEGDVIVYVDEHSIIDSGVYLVGWDAEQGGFGIDDVAYRKYPETFGEINYSATCANEVIVLSTRIGNIWENPKLLQI